MNPLTLHILILSLLSLLGFFFVFYCKHLYSEWQQVDSQKECKHKTELAFGLGTCVGIIALCWVFWFYQTLTTSIFFYLTSPTYISLIYIHIISLFLFPIFLAILVFISSLLYN
jgi:cellulose synthase/poly-beta-1,6-N-acetylglucosamine synthase-like glycosyltransferase